MKSSAPVHVDRLARALRAQGIDIRRSRIIELVAAAFGYHNSNEFQAAARAGDLVPAPAAPAGRMDLDDGTVLVVLRDGEGRPYAIMPPQDGDRSGTIGITPYGGLVTLPDIDIDLPRIAVRQDASAPKAGTVHLAIVEYDIDRIVGAGRIRVLAGTTASERDLALAGFCRDRWDHAHATPDMIVGHLPLQTDGLDDRQIVETYFASTTDVLLDRETVEIGDLPDAGSADVPVGHVMIDLDTLGTLTEAADANADALQDDLQDDSLSSDHLESTQGTLDALNAAVVRARGLYRGEPTKVQPVEDVPAIDASRFVLVSRDALDKVIGAASSHLEDAETGVEDGIYDPEENLWTVDLQAAIDAVESARPIDASSGPVSRPGMVHVAIMRTPHADDVRVSTDIVALDRIVADHCRGNWGSVPEAYGGSLDPSLLPDTQVIETFYAAHGAADEPAYSLDRREETVETGVGASERIPEAHSEAVLHPRLDAAAVAERLRDGIAADIWDTDAPARRDAEAVIEIADTKAAMAEAAEILLSLRRETVPERKVRPSTQPDEPIWLTDVEADVIYDVTRDQLENLGLAYDRGDGKNDWLPLTPDEFERLQPGSGLDGNGGHGRFIEIEGMEGMEIRLGQSCLWQDTKWIVPAVEFGFGEGERDETYRRLEAYVGDLRPLVEAIGGSVRTLPDATDYAHCVDVFVPMDTAMAFQGSEDLLKALEWLLCPDDLRSGLVRVFAEFETFPSFENRWDATFDVLLEGRAWAQSYLMGDRDEQMTMRLAESGLAYKDAWSLWNQNLDLELDIEALKRLYSIR